jgi:hypothetical protein
MGSQQQIRIQCSEEEEEEEDTMIVYHVFQY